MDLVPSEAEAVPQPRKWSQAPGNIEDLDEYFTWHSNGNSPLDPGHNGQSSPQHVYDDLMRYTANQKRIRENKSQSTRPPDSPAMRVLCEVLEIGIMLCRPAIREIIETYHDAHERAAHLLAECRRQRMCRRAETHDIALLPSRKPKITVSNQNQSPLLKLPAELRIRIYDYIHATSTVIFLSNESRNNRICLLGRMKLCCQQNPWCPRTYNPCSRIIPKNALSLPLTCRQIYTETIHYLYDSNTFNFNDNKLILSLSGTLPAKHLGSITSLCLTFGVEQLAKAFNLPCLLRGTPNVCLKAMRRRKQYITLWRFLASTLRNLRTLLVYFEPWYLYRDQALEERIYEWLLPPLFQSGEGKNQTRWSPKLTLFTVRLCRGWGHLGSFVQEYQKQTPPFILEW